MGMGAGWEALAWDGGGGGGRTKQMGLLFWDLDIARKTSRIRG